MIYFSNVDINISKNIYDFLISQNFKEYMNNYKNKLMIFDFVAPIINDFKKNKKNLKILEIGCGNGIHSVLLSYFGQVYATDLENTTVSLGDNIELFRSKLFKQFDKKIIFKKMDADINPFKNEKFDIIFHNSVIEHVPNYTQFNERIKESLKIGGINICITGTPALCIYRIIKNYIFRFPFIFFYSFLKVILFTKISKYIIIKKIIKVIQKKIWHFQPTHKILFEIAIKKFNLNIKEDLKKIDKKELKKYLPSLLHIIREPEYNRIVLKEISNKLNTKEENVILNYILYFKNLINEFTFNLLPQTHSQHTLNVLTEIKEWKINSWKKFHTIKNLKIKTIKGYRYQHLFGMSYNLRHSFFYKIIKIMSKFLTPSFASEFIIVTEKIKDN